MRPTPPVRQVTVCLNGSRRRRDHPAVPLTPAELAISAQAAVAAGAEAIHLHPRAQDGAESLMATHVGAAVGAVRRSCPRIPIGVSTGLWITSGDIWRRTAQVAHWADLPSSRQPDFASVNISEPGFGDLLTILTEAQIGAEAGVWSIRDAQKLADGPYAGGWSRILVEIVNTPAETCTDQADDVLAAVRDAGLSAPVLLHGEREACWPLVRHAARRGLPTRIGLEDTVTGPGGEPVRDNAELVRIALRERHIAAEPGRPA